MIPRCFRDVVWSQLVDEVVNLNYNILIEVIETSTTHTHYNGDT
jgi:hypothetical protein